jgi:hypothetical protein
MFYIVTITSKCRFITINDGSKIIGVYTTEEEATSVANQYIRISQYKKDEVRSFIGTQEEIVEIQKVENSTKISDLKKISVVVEDNNKILKVGDEEYDTQLEYLEDKNLLSETIFQENV